MQTQKHAREGSTLALKPEANVTRAGVSSGPTKKTYVLQILKEKGPLHYTLPSKQKETNLNRIGTGRVDLELSSQV